MPFALVLVVLLARLAYAADPPLEAVARDLVGGDQGVYAVAEDGTVLAAVAADRPVHPASVTKVATTLALLKRLGPDHRFATRLLAAGAVEQGTLHGDLVVTAEGDPALVDESAVLLARALRARGIRLVDGEVRVEGPLVFDWRVEGAAQKLRRALTGASAESRAAAARVDPAAVFLRVGGRHGLADGAVPRVVVVHRSARLVRLVKALNCYSNNVFHVVSDRIGGPPAVERLARESVPAALRDEIVVENAAGAGAGSRQSPRAAVALLAALEQETAARGLTLRDVLPVSGIDPGTLRDRLPVGSVVGKTGTFGSLGASALVGALHTRRRGRVLFAILNHDVPTSEARRRQDAFVRALLAEADGIPWDYRGAAGPIFRDALIEPAE
jgi:serine-type D-Ala-D-Ala carboxypeptidase/endopeptidase (penicillin-binding protein 4)